MLLEDRVYTFLDGLDDRLDNIRGEILRKQPFPTVEQAYADVRKEDQRQSVMLTKEDTGSSLALISKGEPVKKEKATKGDGGCTHCGNPKHTKDTCFKLHGYPEWWKEMKTKKKRESSQAALTTGETHNSGINNSLVPKRESSTASANCSSAHNDSCNLNWIVDSGATDHMTYNRWDFLESSHPQRSHITNANGGVYPVTGAGKVSFSPTFELSNTLLVPSLSSKLMSIGQVTEELKCRVLIYPKFCLFQDILTEEIIGRGTKRDGLYYLDDFSTGRANKVSKDGNTIEEINL
ncbi:hypothetical protein BUMB_04206 [Candidatus Paraburkholderia calva]|nr:hypothetical protein BUMB_04206 [Candidatus Paraburkholderia calva]